MLVMTGRLIRMETRELLHEEGVEDPWDKVALALVACGLSAAAAAALAAAAAAAAARDATTHLLLQHAACILTPPPICFRRCLYQGDASGLVWYTDAQYWDAMEGDM